jgi:transposase InsO family protein
LDNTNANAVINRCKYIFSHHGIPDKFISDNGPPYNSCDFKKFAEEWDFDHETSSPLTAWSNGFAERYVRTVKTLLKKVKQDGTDIQLALLELRNTPVSDTLASPAQILYSRKLRGILPSTDTSLQPAVIDPNTIQETLDYRSARSKLTYDKMSNPLKELKPGDPIRVKDSKTWKPGIVTSLAHTPRSYNIKTADGNYRRNRRFLRYDTSDSFNKGPNESQTALDITPKSMDYVPKSKDMTPINKPSNCSDIHMDKDVPSEPLTNTGQSHQQSYYETVSKPDFESNMTVQTRSGRSVKPRKILDL